MRSLWLLLCLTAAAVAGEPRATVPRVICKAGSTTAYGSGVLASVRSNRGIVLTNWHVVRSPRESITVRWHGGHDSPGEVIAADTVWDLAAVRVNCPADAVPVPLAATAPRIGDRLTIAGHGGGEYLEQSGTVVGWMSPASMNDYALVEVRTAARLGDSGGPILTDDGKLAGVLYGVYGGHTVGPCCTRVAGFLVDAEAAP